MTRRRRSGRSGAGLFDMTWQFPEGPEFPPSASSAPRPDAQIEAPPPGGANAVRVEQGDCRAVMAALLAEGVRVDAVVTDSPYELDFMGQAWDRSGIAYDPAVWRGAPALLKPGGHLLAFGGTRTYHRMACAIEDAGFQMRDMLSWLYGSGFPKSRDMGKALDAEAGVVGDTTAGASGKGSDSINAYGDGLNVSLQPRPSYLPASVAGRQWQGWGTALKPACEPIALARKPFEGTVAANVRRHGTGAINIDGCRVETADSTRRSNRAEMGYHGGNLADSYQTGSDAGRWPANVIHDGSDEVVARFPETGISSGGRSSQVGMHKFRGTEKPVIDGVKPGLGDSGSASRFFYTAKADAADRLGSRHPTVKPVDLMAWLCRLVTPPGGVVLDPFAGSGTTAMACLREGFRAIVIDLRAECVADIRRRLAHVTGADTPLFGRAP